jgi:O-antigen/teichoic acid export membrane protein
MRGPQRPVRESLVNFLYKALSSPIEKACRLVVMIAVAHAIGPAAFGAYQVAITVVVFLTLATELGLGTWTTRAVARDASMAAPVLASAMRLRAAAVVPYFLLLAIVSATQASAAARWGVALLGVAGLASSFVDYFGAILRGYEDFRREAALNLARAVVTCGAVLATLRFAPTLVGAAAGSAIGAIASAAIGVAALRERAPVVSRLFSRRSPDHAQTLARGALGEIVSIWLTGVLSTLYFRCDVLLLRALAGDAQVGLYSAAYRVFEAWTLLPGAVMAVGFPRVVRARDPSERAAIERGVVLALCALGVAAAAVSLAADRWLVEEMFGSQFVRASGSLRVLAFALPLLFVNFGLSQFLLARGRERAYLALSAVLLAVNVGLNLALIPPAGGAGAAWATLVTEAVRTAGCLAILAAA